VRKIILPIILILSFMALFLPKFVIKAQVDCKSQFGECPSEVITQLTSLNGKSIHYAKKEIDKYLSSNRLVSEFGVQFKLPNILRVDMIVKKPVFALGNGEGFAFIDASGVVLTRSSENALPVVTIGGALPNIGENVDANTLFSLKLIDGVYKMYQTRTGTIEGSTLVVDLSGPVRVIFPLEEADRDLLLGSLRLIYANIQSAKEGPIYSQIDLRYKNPVLR